MNKIANNEIRTNILLALISVLFLSFIFASPAFAAENIEYYDFQPGNEFTVERVIGDADQTDANMTQDIIGPALFLIPIVMLYILAVSTFVLTIGICLFFKMTDKFDFIAFFAGIAGSGVIYAIATVLLINLISFY